MFWAQNLFWSQNFYGPKFWQDLKNSKQHFFPIALNFLDPKFFEAKIFLGIYICFWSKTFWTKNLFEVLICFGLKPRSYQTGVWHWRPSLVHSFLFSFLILYFTVIYVSHVELGHFLDPVGHFGTHFWPYWIMRWVRHCSWWASLLALLGWYWN